MKILKNASTAIMLGYDLSRLANAKTVVYSTFPPNVFKLDNIFNVELIYGYIFHENSRINNCFVYCLLHPKIASFGLFKKVFAHLHNKYELNNHI